MNLDARDGMKWLPHNSNYRCRTEAFSTKTGLSICAVIGALSLLCDRLADLTIGSGN
jgi:hypothetical protein